MPGVIAPCFSASSIMARPMRSCGQRGGKERVAALLHRLPATPQPNVGAGAVQLVCRAHPTPGVHEHHSNGCAAPRLLQPRLPLHQRTATSAAETHAPPASCAALCMLLPAVAHLDTGAGLQALQLCQDGGPRAIRHLVQLQQRCVACRNRRPAEAAHELPVGRAGVSLRAVCKRARSRVARGAVHSTLRGLRRPLAGCPLAHNSPSAPSVGLKVQNCHQGVAG